MNVFRTTTHLSEILEESKNGSVVIFKYSNSCKSSADLESQIAQKVSTREIQLPLYKVTVQTHPVLSKKIEEWFSIKHESPQILLVDNGKVIYTEHHKRIDLSNLINK